MSLTYNSNINNVFHFFIQGFEIFMKKNIIIKGASEHNLKNIDVILPRNKLIVFTGVSGSGKSSLAFDTLYAEGQRRYIESLSSNYPYSHSRLEY